MTYNVLSSTLSIYSTTKLLLYSAHLRLVNGVVFCCTKKLPRSETISITCITNTLLLCYASDCGTFLIGLHFPSLQEC